MSWQSAIIELERPVALTEAQSTRLSSNLAHPRSAWISPPLLAGAWNDLNGARAHAVLARLGQQLQLRGMPLPLALHLDRVRTRMIACFGGALLVEVQGYGPLSEGEVTGIRDSHGRAEAPRGAPGRAATEGIGGFILHAQGVT